MAKSMTVNAAHNVLTRLISEGHGNIPLGVNVNSLALCPIGIPISGVGTIAVESVLQDDGNDNVKFDSKGREVTKRMAVLSGAGTKSMCSALSRASVDKYVAKVLSENGFRTEEEQELISSAIHDFVSHLRKLTE